VLGVTKKPCSDARLFHCLRDWFELFIRAGEDACVGADTEMRTCVICPFFQYLAVGIDFTAQSLGRLGQEQFIFYQVLQEKVHDDLGRMVTTDRMIEKQII
jgi:hypothetical protein